MIAKQVYAEIDMTCPNCHADLSKDIDYGAYCTGYGMPPSTVAMCEECGVETEYRFEWEPVLVKCFPVAGSAA